MSNNLGLFCPNKSVVWGSCLSDALVYAASRVITSICVLINIQSHPGLDTHGGEQPTLKDLQPGVIASKRSRQLRREAAAATDAVFILMGSEVWAQLISCRIPMSPRLFAIPARLLAGIRIHPNANKMGDRSGTFPLRENSKPRMLGW